MIPKRDVNRDAYEPLRADGFGESLHETPTFSTQSPESYGVARFTCYFISLLVAVGLGFLIGVLVTLTVIERNRSATDLNAAKQIPLPTVLREFSYSTPFSKEPPEGEKTGGLLEPIWDSLIPNGLGYFQDEQLAPSIVIPTVFHQLHCLYILRRAYYSHSDELQEFDFGKERAPHAAHCFDYLQQGLTCSVDSTLEPAVDEKNGFLGSGFQRRCRDYGALKDFVELRRVFNATGFLAHGLDHGHVQ